MKEGLFKTKARLRHCYLCGESINGKPERDHVIPKQFFEEGSKPEQMYTLPVCPGDNACNRKIAKDEEYVKAVVLAQCYGQPSASKIWDKRFLPRLKPGLRNSLIRSMSSPARPLTFYSDAGLDLGSASFLSVDSRRFSNVMRKIVRGLYYREVECLLPQNTFFSCWHLGPQEKAPYLAMEAMGNLMKRARRRVEHPGVFTYWFAVTKEDTSVSGWWLLFYDKVLVQVLTDSQPPPVQSEVPRPLVVLA